jgi:hypothetical protein
VEPLRWVSGAASRFAVKSIAKGWPTMPERSGLQWWGRTHFFRTWTAIATLIGLMAAYYYRPEWLTWWLRATTAAIEKFTDALPYPWGDRIEIPLRVLGGSFWIQITVAIVIVRIAAWLVGQGCRHGWQRLRARRAVIAVTQRRDALDRLPSSNRVLRSREARQSRTLS